MYAYLLRMAQGMGRLVSSLTLVINNVSPLPFLLEHNFIYVCFFTAAAPAIIYDSVSFDLLENGEAVNVTWTVLPLDQVRGFVTFVITYMTSNRKRQDNSIRVPYEQGGAVVSGLDPDRNVEFSVGAVNEDSEAAMGGGVTQSITSE